MSFTPPMTHATPAQVQRLQMLRRQLGMDEEQYRTMILGASDGRTSSSRQLTQHEAFELINALIRSTDENYDAADTMRKKIISMAIGMLWVSNPITYAAGDPPRADMRRINTWCKTYGYLKKGLNSYTYHELPKLVSQFQQVYISAQKKKTA